MFSEKKIHVFFLEITEIIFHLPKPKFLFIHRWFQLYINMEGSQIIEGYVNQLAPKHSGVKPHACKLCDKFIESGSLAAHVIDVHEKLKPHKGRGCGKAIF